MKSSELSELEKAHGKNDSSADWVTGKLRTHTTAFNACLTLAILSSWEPGIIWNQLGETGRRRQVRDRLQVKQVFVNRMY